MGALGKSTVGVGVQYGDEGKIKVYRKVVPPVAVWVRWNGGPNSGHNFDANGIHLVTHSVPSGIGYPNTLQYIGSGCTINPSKLLQEINYIQKELNISLDGLLHISTHTSLIQPHEIILDVLTGAGIGTTGNGIGPAYADQALRQIGSTLTNIKLGDFLQNSRRSLKHIQASFDNLIESAEQSLVGHGITSRKIKKVLDGLDREVLLTSFSNSTLQLKQYLCSDPLFLQKIIEQGYDIFFEGANAAMLDVQTGHAPYTTSSHTLASAAYVGGDLSNRYHTKTIGVAKAIMSRVGNGPFTAEFGGIQSEKYCSAKGGKKYVRDVEEQLYNPSDLLKSSDPFKIGIALRMLGNEYGATTQRPRRVGMLDLVMLRQTCLMNGVDELYVTKFDMLNLFSEGVPLVVAYELDGKRIDYVPPTTDEARHAKPIVEYALPITKDISSIRSFKRLPKEAKDLVRRIEDATQTPVYGIGVGPGRDEYVSTTPSER